MMRSSHFEQFKKSIQKKIVYKAFRPAGSTFAQFVSLSISSKGVIQRRFFPKWRPDLHMPIIQG
jgi:hypothetical protein